MAKKENEEYKLERVDSVNFTEMTLGDLMQYKDAADMLFRYYDNQSKANMGLYDEYSETEYKESKALANKYMAIQTRVFEEIKKKVDALNA